MLAHRESTICWRSRPEAMLTEIYYMPWLTAVLVYSCNWTLSDKSFKASSVSSHTSQGNLVVIQVWSILPGRFFTLTCAMRMKRVLRSLLSEFTGHIRDCGVVCQSNVDTPLRACESHIQQSVLSHLAIFDHTLEDPRRDDVPGNPQ